MEREPSVLIPAIWMIVISLLLFWLPGFGPLIAGYVGGRRAGDVGHAFVASLLPMVLVGAAVFIILTLVVAPILGPLAPAVGAIAGTLTVIYLIVLEIALIAGAVVGGLLAQK